MLSLSIILPIVAKMDGEKIEPSTGLPFMFVGLIGVSAYEIVSRLYKRVIALEQLAESKENNLEKEQ